MTSVGSPFRQSNINPADDTRENVKGAFVLIYYTITGVARPRGDAALGRSAKPDAAFLPENFLEHRDRKALCVGAVEVEL
ncbi:MAG: hypothetical protein V3W11_12185 [bacterium]